MTEEKQQVQEITMTNTKAEMLAAYQALVKHLQGKREVEAKPEERIEEKQDKQAVETADSLSTEGIGKEIGNLKAEIGGMLALLSDKMDEEIGKYLRTTRAVEVRERQLKEIYEIEKSASALTALLEIQRDKRGQFEAEMATRKAELESEIEETRRAWKTEQAAHEAAIRERDEAEKKRRGREAEEYKYASERERQVANEQFAYEKAKVEREMQFKREETERDLVAREGALKEREAELQHLRQQVESFPEELEAVRNRAIQETVDRLRRESDAKAELMTKEFDGEIKVLNARVESLQATAKEQNAHIAKLSAQLEKSYAQVQDIAVKAIEGSSKLFAGVQGQPFTQPSRKGPGEE